MKWISYDKETMCLSINIGKYYKYLECPFATWWKARKYFVKPKFTFYFGPTCKYHGKKVTRFGEYEDWEPKGFWPAVNTEWLKWRSPKWFPITIISQDIGWKDKWNSPRYETPGYFIIYFGKTYHHSWQIGFRVDAPEFFIYDCTKPDTKDFYWESILWFLYYYKNYHSKKPNLLKARNTLQSRWTTTKLTLVKKYEILSTREENILKSQYFVVSLKCRYLTNLLSYQYGLCQKPELSLYITKDDKRCIAYSNFINNIDNKAIDIYILKRGPNSRFIEMMKSEFDSIEINLRTELDLGPTFKDQFLTKKGQKIIKDGLH